MKNKIFRVTIILLVVLGFSTSTTLQAVAAEKTTGRSVTAQFGEFEGCVSTDIFISAWQDNRQENLVGVRVSIISYDSCQQKDVFAAVGESFIDPADLHISNNLSTAELRTNLSMYNRISGETFDVRVDMDWTATGEPVRWTDHYKEKTRECHYVNHLKTTDRQAVAAGSISGGPVDFPGLQFPYANLYSFTEWVIYNGGDCGGG